MSNRNKTNYFTENDLKKIEKDCDYLFILGERSAGKSYAVKTRLLKNAYKRIKDNKCYSQFAYVRRFDMDCKDSMCVPYFADMPISTITDGKYTLIDVFRKKIYFANIDEETNKIKRGVCIGQCFSLSGAQHYKSLMFPYIDNIIYEEIISQNNQYLYKEPSMLQQLVSTILRDRKGRVYLIGNTISRMCPYYREWQLDKVERLEEGHILKYNYNNTCIKIYRTNSRHFNSGMFFGNIGKNITEGEYITEEFPHLKGNIKDYETLYTCVVKVENFMFLLSFLKKDEIYTWYIQPKTTPIQDKTRVISNEYNSSVYWTHGFLPFTNNEQKIFSKLLLYKKVVYSDNLTGTEFNNILHLLTN